MRSIIDFMGTLEGLGLLDDMYTLQEPPDAERCLTCQYHPTNMQLREEEKEQHCYMFMNLPDTLCMQHKQSYKLSAAIAATHRSK
jgi:hypothetical protein